MDLDTFIVSVFCLIDDRLEGRRIRRRGPAPKLSDSEVITMENRRGVMRDLAERGRDSELGRFLGMRAHVLIAWPGMVPRAGVCAADVHDTHLAERLLEGMGRAWVLADRNYRSPLATERLRDLEGGPTLMARFELKGEAE